MYNKNRCIQLHTGLCLLIFCAVLMGTQLVFWKNYFFLATNTQAPHRVAV